MKTATIVKHTERLDTAVIGVNCTDDRDQARADIIALFLLMATDAGKIATASWPADWTRVSEAMHNLRWQAVETHCARSRTFAHAGSEAALVTQLIGFAAVLGFRIEDAATAPVDADDLAATAAVEGEFQEAAE